jgi:glyoxylase-like metal-dependent hydrolase (beta-lactamase superfamily II)
MPVEDCLIEKVGSRGTLFVYDDLDGLPTTVYLINTPRHVFIVDTFLGPESMEPVLRHMAERCPGKPVVVFNTHYHWDHIWGNCAFPGATVAAHRLTRPKMAEVGQQELTAYQRYRRGAVDLVLPHLTFDARLCFEDDGVEFFHSPGHTQDSTSGYDRIDNVLLVGDNVELPLPYLNWDGLGRYLKTLEGYEEIGAARIIAGHCPKVTKEAIDVNMEYLREFMAGNTEWYETGEGKATHAQNVAVIGRLRGKT